MRPKLHSQKGQALLIVVLVMVVALTVGLSVASRSVTNLRTSIEEENSQRAFSAAEAGVEQVIKTGQAISTSQSLENHANIESVSVQKVVGSEFLLNGGNFIPQDDGVDIWLSSYPDYTNQWPQGGNGSLTFFWGQAGDNCNTGMAAALEVIVLSGTRLAPVTTRYGFDPCSNRIAINGLSGTAAGTYSVGGKNFSSKATVGVTSGTGLIARVIPLYTNTVVGVKACDENGANCIALPSQGQSIDSVGASGGTKRKITVFQGYPQLPSELFPYILFQTKP